MACGVALKRPYDYDAYVSPDDATDVKRRCTNTGCSPFRPYLGTLAASLPNASSAPIAGKLNSGKDSSTLNSSPFALAATRIQLSPGQLQSYLKAEVRSLKRRRLLPKRLFVERLPAECSANGKKAESESDCLPQHPVVKGDSHLTSEYRVAPESPTANVSSDSDGETSANSLFFNQRLNTAVSIFDKPQFSLKQVQLVCERLLKQQEIRIRFEYENKLNKLLQEQHEQFIQFIREQEKQQSSSNTDELSYYS